jgi:predicted ATPase
MNAPVDHLNSVTITSVRFRNFKGLESYSIAFEHMNILVGPNNAGSLQSLGRFESLLLA